MSATSLPFEITAIRHDFAIPVTPGRLLPRWVHSFVVQRRHWIAIDAGVSGSAATILGATGGELATLLMTHGHPDHLGAARTLKERTRCTIAAPAAERHWIETPEKQLSERPVPGFWTLVEGKVAIDAALADGDEAPGASGLVAIATPGHSPGHVAYWDAKERILFSGDAIPVPGEMPIYDDARAARASLETMRALHVSLLLSAWDEPREGAAARNAIVAGIEVLETVGRCVENARAQTDDLIAITRSVARSLGLSAELAGPMLARTVRAHLI